MKERPIIFNGAMVRAILSGQKTQTRRAMKRQPPERWSPVTLSSEPDLHARTYTQGVVDRDGYLQAGPEVFGVADEEWGAVSPFGQPGDRLWVRETFGSKIRSVGGTHHEYYAYRASEPGAVKCYDCNGNELPIRWTPSIHMPRKAARILLEINDVRVERLNDISERDALAEGVQPEPCDHARQSCADIGCCGDTARGEFGFLWQSIYGQESWEANPWVWVVEFKPINIGEAS
ncbi:hypothetical protein [Aeromonas hydrophila]|uniref:hypothetical protein n=1 Tax=Aeromonas hydrophila TaxID=644 RepID=UPI00235FA7AB|nr:hypothetical protein [Aeromonas hydrophila]